MALGTYHPTGSESDARFTGVPASWYPAVSDAIDSLVSGAHSCSLRGCCPLRSSPGPVFDEAGFTVLFPGWKSSRCTRPPRVAIFRCGCRAARSSFSTASRPNTYPGLMRWRRPVLI